MNCDDHTKNLAFLCDAAGNWRLAPAYDKSFSHNPAAGKWTRQHQMLVGGKAWDIDANDLIALARQFDIRQPETLLERITDAVAAWPKFAREAGVSADKIAHVAGYHPAWVTAV